MKPRILVDALGTEGFEPRGGERVRVRERIVDAEGDAFTDTSSWFRAALLGRSTGPWLAVTTVTTVDWR